MPLLIVNLTHTGVGADAMTLLVALYTATISINVRAHSRHVLAAFRLRAENEALARNLVRADAATAEAARSK